MSVADGERGSSKTKIGEDGPYYKCFIDRVKKKSVRDRSGMEANVQ